MLKLFETTGFKNFINKTKIDFSDVRDYQFNKQCITNDVIGKMIIYGKNSVGKSNLGLALFDIVSHLSSKHVTPGVYDYYLNSMSKETHADFHYVFEFDLQEIDYSYSKNENQELIFERIGINNDLLFEFNYETKQGDLEGIKRIAPTLNWTFNDVDSILKYVINNTVLEKSHPLYQMMRYVDNMLWFRSLDENRYIGYKEKSNDYLDFIFDSQNIDEFQCLLNKAGIDEKIISKVNYDGRKALYFKGANSLLPFFKVASNGTKALYTFFYWYKTAKNVSLMFIDEFDAFYHFELAETIVEMLGKMEKTQVILTSHNTNLLTNNIMRPDCFFVLSKDNLTPIFKATDRELRQGHNLEKLYMSGEFDE